MQFQNSLLIALIANQVVMAVPVETPVEAPAESQELQARGFKKIVKGAGIAGGLAYGYSALRDLFGGSSSSSSSGTSTSTDSSATATATDSTETSESTADSTYDSSTAESTDYASSKRDLSEIADEELAEEMVKRGLVELI